VSITHHPVYRVSVEHLPRADEVLLRAQALPPVSELNTGLMAVTRLGILLWIGDEGLSEHDATGLRHRGFSEALARLLERVHEEASACCYVLLEADGCNTVEDLPTFKR
jgi:hypothetical protein